MVEIENQMVKEIGMVDLEEDGEGFDDDWDDEIDEENPSEFDDEFVENNEEENRVLQDRSLARWAVYEGLARMLNE